MTKWADFCITAKRTAGGTIQQLACRVDHGEKLDRDPFALFKEEVIWRIESKKLTFVTVTMDSEGKWKKGEDVRVRTSSSGTKYLRTDSNATDADNLGSLPEF